MSNAEVFSRPGEIAARFVLSLFDKTPEQLDPQMYGMMVIALAILIWVQFCRFIYVMVKRLLGFDPRGYR